MAEAQTQSSTPPKFERKVVKLSDIKTDEKNPNRMNDDQKAALRKSIEKFGYVTDIVVDKNSMMIADGEHRLNELKGLNVQEAEIVLYDFESETDRRLFRQISNKLKGTHDFDLDKDEFRFILENMDKAEAASMLGWQEETFDKYLFSEEPTDLPNFDMQGAVIDLKDVLIVHFADNLEAEKLKNYFGVPPRSKSVSGKQILDKLNI